MTFCSFLLTLSPVLVRDLSMDCSPSSTVLPWDFTPQVVTATQELKLSMGCRLLMSIFTCLTTVSSMGCRELLLHTWSTFCLPSALIFVSAGQFLTHFLTPPAGVQHFNLNTVSQRHHQYCCWLQLRPVVGLLEQSGNSCVPHGAAPDLSLQPLQPLLPKPCYTHPVHLSSVRA